LKAHFGFDQKFYTYARTFNFCRRTTRTISNKITDLKIL
jgi:hypothetical protein